MAKLNKLKKVNENVTVYRYDNGWMVEIGGKDKNDAVSYTHLTLPTNREV